MNAKHNAPVLFIYTRDVYSYISYNPVYSVSCSNIILQKHYLISGA